MGFVSVIGNCYTCQRLFSFSPTRVPSFTVRGIREPICEDCVRDINSLREAMGFPGFAVLPGAYDASDESEM